jgi:hypothetical protein
MVPGAHNATDLAPSHGRFGRQSAASCQSGEPPQSRVARMHRHEVRRADELNDRSPALGPWLFEPTMTVRYPQKPVSQISLLSSFLSASSWHIPGFQR